jgi:hypothetical protein
MLAGICKAFFPNPTFILLHPSHPCIDTEEWTSFGKKMNEERVKRMKKMFILLGVSGGESIYQAYAEGYDESKCADVREVVWQGGS